MKNLTIVDFSHLYNRSLHVAISQANPKVKDKKYITEDFEPYLKHLLFNSLQYIQNTYKGEIILAMDAKHNWRKDFYKDYKGNRAKGKETTELNWDEIHILIDSIIEVIKENFPYKVVRTNKAEADDIAGVLSLKYRDIRKIKLITSDHDWSQNTVYSNNITMFDPIKKEQIILSSYESEFIETPVGKMSRYTAIHSLIGDVGDNVPKVTFESEFSINFLSYLKQNEIMSSSVKTVTKMSIFKKLVDSYNKYVIVKSGKRKGLNKYDYRVWYRVEEDNKLLLKDDFIKTYPKNTPYKVEEVYEKDIFKPVNFGIKKAKEVTKDSSSLALFLKSDEKYLDNFKFSNTLVDVTKVPRDIMKDILQDYNNAKVVYNPDGILEYFINENLGQLVNQSHKFYDHTYDAYSNTTLDDFLS